MVNETDQEGEGQPLEQLDSQFLSFCEMHVSSAKSIKGAMSNSLRVWRTSPPRPLSANPLRGLPVWETARLRPHEAAFTLGAMPLYEFHCQKCEKDSELLVRSNRERAACPKCGSTRLTRKLSVFASKAGSGASEPASCSGTPSSCCACGTGRPHRH